MEMFAVSEIINEISNYYCWEQNTEIDVEDKKSWARDQYQFWMEHILLQDMKKFKAKPQITNSKNVIPVGDVPLVAAILLRAVSKEQEDKLIAEWFNGNIFSNNVTDEKQCRKIVELCNDIDEMFKKIRTDDDYFSGFELNVNLKPTICDCAKWSTVIKSSLNYDMAFWITEFQKRMAEIYTYLLPLKHTTSIGEDSKIFSKIEADVRKNLIKGKLKEFDIEREPVSELLKSCYTQDDYINLIMSITETILEDEKKKLEHDIFSYVDAKKEHNWVHISENFGTESIAQDDRRRFQNIYELFKNDSEALKKLEKISQESNLLEYFRIENQKNNKKKKKKK